MLKNLLQMYINEAADDRDLAVVVRSIETGQILAVTYDLVADISEYGELLLGIAMEGDIISTDTLNLPSRFDSMPKRRSAVKFILLTLQAIRDAQMRALDNTPENLRCFEPYALGETAVDAMNAAIDCLVLAY